MEIQGRHERSIRGSQSSQGSPQGYESTLPAVEPAARALKRRSLRSEARRRRILANVVFVCSSVVALAVLGICYALLRQ
jgi:hypothetical protein